jgi:hypothetical protein
MLKLVLAACLLLSASIVHASASQRAPVASCVEADMMRPVCGTAFHRPSRGFLKGVRSIKVTLHRERHSRISSSYEIFGAAEKPSRYIAGRLVCARNVNAALAERGIRGTGSALALSFRRWGISAGGPVPGAVIVSARRGGGHVAIVSRVANGIVYAWNATGGRHGWHEIPYRHHVIDYRVPG